VRDFARKRYHAARTQRPGPTFARSWLAYEIEASQDRACRVCGGAIVRGDRVLFRSWGVEVAHVACGWLRPEERAPHECSGASAPRAWEWACPTCGRDVVRRDKPTDGADLRCASCAAANDAK
jgi:predicted RNA-binding Zn-ribbon protein involved in translation (DUF1610 family)